MSQTDAIRKLIQKGRELFEAPKAPVKFTGNADADRILNDLENYPHAYVLACVMDRQIKAERAWIIPYRFSQKLDGFQFSKLSSLSEDQIRKLMSEPEPLHRFVDEMSKNFHLAVKTIESKYSGNAENIWSDTPSSAELVYRFLELRGVGQKIGTMAANILARDFKIPLKDRYSIDISVDVQVRRVFERIGFVEQGCSNEQIIYRARAINPEFPGLLDFPAWEIGRLWCRPTSPDCDNCHMASACNHARANG